MLFKNKFRGLVDIAMLSTVFSLAWPTMLEQLLQTAVQYIDTAMVGTLGTHATAAVGATTTVNWLLASTISAIGVGFLAYIAQAYGADHKEMAAKASAQAVFSVLVCGGLFTILCVAVHSYVPVWMQVDTQIQELTGSYFLIVYSPMLARTASIVFGTVLRSVGDTKTPMRIGILVNILNVVLNFLLIYPGRWVTVLNLEMFLPGCGWGVLGAAAATAISYWVGGVLITIALFRHPEISPKGHSIRPDLEVLRPCLRVALPNALQRFGTSLGYVAFASLINALGEVATAAHTIANTVESAFYIPGYGMQTAAATLAGNAYGASDRNKLRQLAVMINMIEVILMILSGGLLFAFAPNMMALFAADRAVVLLGSVVLRMVALSEPFYGVSIILEGMMMGMGQTKEPFVVNIIGMWGIRILGTMFCTVFLNMGLVSAWACMIIHNLFLFVIFLILYPKMLRKKDYFLENST